MPTALWRYAVGIQRLVPFLGYHHMLMMSAAGSIVLIAVLLAGCTSGRDLMLNVYIMAIAYSGMTDGSASSSSVTVFANASVGGQAVIRIGYFGICFQESQASAWICARDADTLLSLIAGDRNDPLNLIGIGGHQQKNVLFPGLLVGALAALLAAFMGLSTFPGWHEELDVTTGEDIDIKPFPAKRTTEFVALSLFLAAIFLFAAAVWQHVIAAGISSLLWSITQESVSGEVGSVAAGLVWTAFFLTAMTYLSIQIMIASIRMLDRLTDD